MTVLDLAETESTAVQPAGTVPQPPSETTVLRGLQSELDTYYKDMAQFGRMDVTDIFMHLAAYSARASEVRGRLSRQASRRIDSFRTRELDPFIDECDRQFRIWSRLQSVRQLEADMSGKAI